MEWEKDKNTITEKYFESINLNNIELFGIIRENHSKARPIFPLIKFILSRLVTVTMLLQENRLWDAEIILRSALETFIKLLFITTAEKAEQRIRVEEYWHSLAEINLIKQSAQAKKNLEYFKDSEIHRLAYLPLILKEEEEVKLRKKWPKSLRQKIEQKWSFSEMVRNISQQNSGKPLEMIVTTAHHYRMSSHVMHGDETGISIIDERESRSSEEFEKATAGHFLRLISDCLVYCAFTAVETMSFLNLEKNKQFFFNNQKNVKDVDELFKKYEGKVFEDEHYNSFRKRKEV